MNIDEVFFYITYALVGVAWIPLLIVPQKRFANWWLAGLLIPSVISVMFTYLLLTDWNQPANQSFIEAVINRFMSLQGVGRMMAVPGLRDATWLDNLTTGMMAGAWITRRAQRTKLARPLLLLCQLLVCSTSPLGVLTYFVIEGFRGQLQEPDGASSV